MADIEVVVKIPEEEYRWIMKSDKNSFADVASKECMLHAIKNGTPLSKGHGRLIDAGAFIEKMKDASKRQEYKELLIDDYLTVDDVFKAIIESLQNEGLANGDAPTIIEADTEGKYASID